MSNRRLGAGEGGGRRLGLGLVTRCALSSGTLRGKGHRCLTAAAHLRWVLLLCVQETFSRAGGQVRAVLTGR